MNTRALHKLSYGLYVVTSRKGDKLNGQIANTVFQITSEPPTIAVSINKKNLTHEFKSGRDIDKLEGIDYKPGETKAPIIIENAVAYLEAKVIKEIDVGTHTVFIGELVNADILTEEEPMTYEYYHKVKRGTTPKTAPSYIEEKKGGSS